MTTTATANPASLCGDDGCDARDTWPLHHVRHRGSNHWLCTCCVLKYHPGSFCTLCFDIVDAGSPAVPPAPAVVVHCSKCPSVCHRSCLPNPDLASLFVCPSCKNPEGFRYFPDGKRRVIGSDFSKALLAAAVLSVKSMNRAAAQARAEAERKMKVALLARKRSREMLERVIALSEEKEKNCALVSVAKADVVVVEEPKKKKMAKVGGAGSGGVREFEKWSRWNEMVPGTMDGGQGVGVREKLKVGAHTQVKSRAPNGSGKEEKQRKGNLLSSHSVGGVKKEESTLMRGGAKGPRLPQSTQDALVSRTNPRSILMGSASRASLHS